MRQEGEAEAVHFVSAFGGVNRSEIENEAASLEEPCWGEVLNGK